MFSRPAMSTFKTQSWPFSYQSLSFCIDDAFEQHEKDNRVP